MAFSGQSDLDGTQATLSWFVISIRLSFKLPEIVSWSPPATKSTAIQFKGFDTSRYGPKRSLNRCMNS